MNTNPRTIHGYKDLQLIVGNLYDIHYGVNQGVYKYLGQVDDVDDFWYEASIFINIETGKSFYYFGITSPYEFTSIVTKHK